MTMTDPIADMLTRLRNASTAMHDDVKMPTSRQKEALAALLLSEGYIGPFSVEENPTGPQKVLNIKLKYSPERERVISGIQRISKPGLRVYTKYTEVPRVLGGLGISIVSTSQGLMTDREARKRRVGGEILCQVW